MPTGNDRNTPEREQVPKSQPNIAAAVFGLAALAFFALLYILNRYLYFTIIDWWSFRPFKYPFIDLVYIPAQIDCWNQGIDVYAATPCDPLGRVHDYSPLWLRLSFLAHAKSFIAPIGVSLDGLFMLSLAALPRPRHTADYIPLLLGIISPMTVFAMERGNIDSLMFLFTLAAVVCMDRALPVRLLGYSAVMIASLLKFYPFVLFILLLRERFRNFLLAAIAAVCIMGGFVLFNASEVRRMLANVPKPSDFTDAFGALQLPEGLDFLAHRLLDHLGMTIPNPVRLPEVMVVGLAFIVLMILPGIATARLLCLRHDFRSALRLLNRRENLTLVAGAMLIGGCFLSGRSINYRGIMILLALPGLSAMARTSPSITIRRLFQTTTWIALLLMFYLPPQRLIYNLFGSLAKGGASPIAISFWGFRELCWWWFVTILAAILACFILDSPVWLTMTGRPPTQKKRSNQASVSAGASSAM